MNYQVYVKSHPSAHAEYEYVTDNEEEAINQAKDWSKKWPEKLVFISFFRKSDGQSGYLNKNGYEITGVTWTK